MPGMRLEPGMKWPAGRYLKALLKTIVVVTLIGSLSIASAARLPSAVSGKKSASPKLSGKSVSTKGKGKKRLNQAHSKKEKKEAKTLGPSEFVEKRAAAVYAALLSRPPRGLPSATVLVATSSKKGPWLASLYERNLVEASAQTERLSDKLIMFRVLEQAIGFKAAQYYPRTLGLKEFLEKHRLVDNQGRLQADGERIEQALFAEFPAGFVVRPAVGVAPMETRKGLYPEGDEFIAALVAGKFPGYEPKHFRRPVSSHILDDVASGEAVVLQDDVILRAESRKKLKSRTYREVRVHTYENKVVADSIPTRWVQETNVDEESARRVEVFVGEFLDALPSRMLSRQAWGVDVAVFDNGELLITDIVTNRGRKIQWSSYLEQPRIIGAYARHFEREAGLRFEGVAGLLMRNNFGNYFPYWDTRIEKSRPGLNKLLSYLPPLP